MKPTVVSAEALFDAHRASLRWEWIAGHAHPERRFDEVVVRDAQSAADLVGYLNYIHPNRVQIVGRREVAYLNGANAEVTERRIARDDPHDGAVLRGNVVDVRGRIVAAGARHVLGHNRRIARQVLADVARATMRV